MGKSVILPFKEWYIPINPMINPDFQIEKQRFRLAIAKSLIPIGLIWLTYAINSVFALQWNDYGMHPRSLQGIYGIFTMPFLHADIQHIFSNTIPLWLLTFGIFYFFSNKAVLILVMSTCITGILTWTIASQGIHIGASGIVYALAFFLVTISIIKMETSLMAYTLIIIFLYGTLVWGFFPSLFPDKHISWEGHLAGAITGVILAFFYKNEGPVRKVYDFEEEEDDENDDFEDFDKSQNEFLN